MSIIAVSQLKNLKITCFSIHAYNVYKLNFIDFKKRVDQIGEILVPAVKSYREEILCEMPNEKMVQAFIEYPCATHMHTV